MRIKASAPCLLSLAFMLAIGCDKPIAAPTSMTYRFDAPQRRVVIQRTTSKQTMSILGESFEQIYEEDQRYTLDIGAGRPDGYAPFTSTLDFFSLEMENSLLESNGSGMDPAAMMIRPVNEALRVARGLSFTGSISPNGRVRGLEGLDELQEEVLQKLKKRTLPPEFTGTALMEEIVEKIFNEHNTTLTLEQILLPRPSGPITEGRTWSGITEITFGVTSLPADVEFTVKSITPSEIVVTEKVKFAIDAAGEEDLRKSLSPDTPFEVEITGNGTGTYHVDPSTGWVTKHKQNLFLNGKYDFGGAVLAFSTRISRANETYSE